MHGQNHIKSVRSLQSNYTTETFKLITNCEISVTYSQT